MTAHSGGSLPSPSSRRARTPASAAARERDFLDQVYAAAVEPALWPALLDGLSDLLDAGAINLTRLNLEDGGGTGLVRRTDPEWMSTYFEHYAAINPFTAGPRDTPWRPTVYLDEQVMDRDRYVRTEFYNDFFVHVGSQWSMVLRLSLTDDHVSTIHLGRDDRGGRFEHAALATARRVLPHLVRAYTLSTRLDESRGLGDAVRAGLDHVREALVLTDGTGRIQHANAAAERLLTLGTVLRSDGGRLAAVHPLSAPRLAVLIAAAGSTNEPVSGAMSLPAPGRLPLGVIVTPVQPERPGLFAPAPAVVVSVSDPGGAAPPSPSRLAERHGLTPAESRVAMALYEGMTPREIAARFGLSANTVRVQLAAVFAKTGVHRQADLVRLLAAEGSDRM